MALFVIGQANVKLEQSNFLTVRDHYLASGLVYPATLKRMGHAVQTMHDGWALLMNAPATIFQLHMGCQDRRIVGSVSAFRDTEPTYVIQHAASDAQPAIMLRCIRSLVERISADVHGRFLSFYFRPEDAWPRRLVRNMTAAHPSHLSSVVEREYLVYRTVGLNAHVSCWTEIVEDNAEIMPLVVSVVGKLHAESMGIGQYPLNLSRLDQAYACAGLRRQRQVVGARRDGMLAGIAVRYTGTIPMNLNFLCQRVEILVHPDAPRRADVVRELASAALSLAAGRAESPCILMLDPLDVPAAVTTGFVPTGTRYTNVIWARDSQHGWPSILGAVENMYQAALPSVLHS
jgi:hypothetical protein